MRNITHIVRATTLVTGLALFSFATAVAQAATHAQSTTAPKITNASRSYTSSRSSTPRVTSFRMFAAKLNTTSAALDSTYKTAEAANRRLSRGQYIETNVLAQNLGSKYPAVTVQAILDGLKSGKSMGKTLQSLGLSAKDADNAQNQANREMRSLEREASHAPKDPTK